MSTSNPTRITFNGGPKLHYPEDIGKKIKLSGSSGGNDGEWVIDKLFQEGTLQDLSTFDTELPEQTNVCEVTGATFVTESGLTWQLNPAFVVDAGGIEWEMDNAGTDGGGTTMVLPKDLPVSLESQLMAVTYSDVLSAQVLLDNTVANSKEGDDPVTFDYYPFYLADPLGYVREYAESVTAAGIIPEFSQE